ncbi:hypothetical protein F6453_0835 [Marinobacter nauticus]|uniref:Uncharacterized protein n=1 Tax=Marinobacter nauticus TaxID=2743 RepID=A0A833NEG1_MARNT|nr:hypothetical protein F6453_0835 [Marinobacter nauticus]
MAVVGRSNAGASVHRKAKALSHHLNVRFATKATSDLS